MEERGSFDRVYGVQGLQNLVLTLLRCFLFKFPELRVHGELAPTLLHQRSVVKIAIRQKAENGKGGRFGLRRIGSAK